MNDNTEPSCLTISQLKRRWRCSRKVILEAVARGELHVFRVGSRAYRVTLSEVERYEQTSKGAA